MKICRDCGVEVEPQARDCPACDGRLIELPGGKPDPLSTLVGRTIDGRYLVESQIGVGGMGAVFSGVQTAIGRPVAIKFLSRQLAGDPHAVRRFNQEARAASALGHPNTITIHDFGQTSEGLLYLVMELVRGKTLTELVTQDGRLLPGRVLTLLVQILDALEVAHACGVVHRDLKPDNVLVTEQGGKSDFVKVLDFGIAKLMDGSTKGHTLTQSGQLFGTPAYMSPEQAQGEPVDARTDLYAVGVITYELLTGRLPFEGDTPLSLLVKHLHETHLPFHRIEPRFIVHPEVQAFVDRALAKPREDRFQTAAEMRDVACKSFEAELRRDSGPPQTVLEPVDRRHVQAELDRAPPPKPEATPTMAAWESAAYPRRRLPLTLGAFGLLAAAAGALAWWGVGDAPTRTRSAESPAPVAVAATSDAVVEAVAASRDATPAEKPSTVYVALEALPSDAKVKVTELVPRPGGKLKRVGRRTITDLPNRVRTERGRTLRLEFSRAGYKTVERELVVEADQVIAVELAGVEPPVPRPRTSRRRRRPRHDARSAAAAAPKKPAGAKRAGVDDLK